MDNSLSTRWRSSERSSCRNQLRLSWNVGKVRRGVRHVSARDASLNVVVCRVATRQSRMSYKEQQKGKTQAVFHLLSGSGDVTFLGR